MVVDDWGRDEVSELVQQTRNVLQTSQTENKSEDSTQNTIIM